ncbi:hypothetical protein DSUL_130007 [Desulfovibrionales bacterium]
MTTFLTTNIRDILSHIHELPTHFGSIVIARSGIHFRISV